MASRKTTAVDPSELIPFTFRMPRGLIAALDARLVELNQASPFTPITRSDLIRDLLASSLKSSVKGQRGR